MLSLLCDILTDDEDFVFEPFALRGALVAAIRRGAPRYVKLLGDASPDVRAQAARILAYHPGTGTLLARRVADEKDRRVQGTLLIAAAMQKQRPKLAAKDAVVRTCVALATLVAGGELTGALVDTLFAAVDDTKQDGGCALFHGNLRAAAIDALGRFGRGNAQVTDGLLARRGKEQRIGAIPAKRAIGQLAVEALAALAVTKRGTTRCSLGD